MRLFGNLLNILKSLNYTGLNYLIFLTVLLSFLEAIGVGAIIPMLTIMLNSDFLALVLQKINDFGIFDFNENTLLIAFSIIFIVFYICKSVFIVHVINKQNEFVYNLQPVIRNRFFNNYLNQNYETLINVKHADVISNITNTIGAFTQGFLSAFFIAASELLVLLSILVLMFFYNPLFTSVLVISFSIITYFYFKIVSPVLKNYGVLRTESENNIISYIKLAIQNIKEIKIFSKEIFFLKLFDNKTKISAKSSVFYNSFQQYPRVAIEMLLVLCVCVAIIYMAIFNVNKSSALITVGFLAGAVFRIMPSLNRLIHSYQSIKYSKYVLNIINDGLNLKVEDRLNKLQGNKLINFKNELIIEDLSFYYNSNVNKLIFEGANAKFYKNCVIAVTGKSGIGKSTLIDILLGLLRPKKGKILADGVNVHENTLSWYSQCSYVSQNLFFFNDSIKKNIAFGIDDQNIDNSKINNCINLSQISNFVNNLANKENTFIGENGINLSGGERQRLAIARSLYREAKIFLFDEATNALDSENEIKIFELINKLKSDKIIFLISHSKEALNYSDKVVKIQDRKIIFE